MFPPVMPAAIIHLNFHSLCDLVSGALIALLVNTFQYLMSEIVLIIFLSLRSIGKLQQSVGTEKNCEDHFFEPIVGDILGTTSSCARANIIGESEFE
jgi:hypothetical protein